MSDLRDAADALNAAGDENERAMVTRASQLEAQLVARRIAGKALTLAEEAAMIGLRSAIDGALKR